MTEDMPVRGPARALEGLPDAEQPSWGVDPRGDDRLTGDQPAAPAASLDAGDPHWHVAETPAPRRTWAGLPARLTPLVLGLLVGALLGCLLGVVQAPQAVATTRVAVLPDPPLATDTDQSSTDPDRFVQAQVLVLGGEDLVSAVTQKLGLSKPPTVSVTQVGTTDVVELDVTADTSAEAVAVAGDLVDRYRQQRRDALAARVDAALAVVDGQIKALDDSGVSSRAETEYSRLLEVRNQLQLSRASSQDQVQVVEQPRAEQPSRAGRALRFGLMGLVLGGLVGLLVTLLVARAGRREQARAGR